MRKSEAYTLAMKAVLRADFSESKKIEILELLMRDRSTALFVEGREEAAE